MENMPVKTGLRAQLQSANDNNVIRKPVGTDARSTLRAAHPFSSLFFFNLLIGLIENMNRANDIGERYEDSFPPHKKSKRLSNNMV